MGLKNILNELFKIRKTNAKKFAEKNNMSPYTIYSILRRDIGATENTISLFSNALNIPYLYLDNFAKENDLISLSIGNRIKEARNNKHMDIISLLQYLNLSDEDDKQIKITTLQNWENGIEFPDSYDIGRLSAILDTRFNYLFYDNLSPADTNKDYNYSISAAAGYKVALKTIYSIATENSIDYKKVDKRYKYDVITELLEQYGCKLKETIIIDNNEYIVDKTGALFSIGNENDITYVTETLAESEKFLYIENQGCFDKYIKIKYPGHEEKTISENIFNEHSNMLFNTIGMILEQLF